MTISVDGWIPLSLYAYLPLFHYALTIPVPMHKSLPPTKSPTLNVGKKQPGNLSIMTYMFLLGQVMLDHGVHKDLYEGEPGFESVMVLNISYNAVGVERSRKHGCSPISQDQVVVLAEPFPYHVVDSG